MNTSSKSASLVSLSGISKKYQRGNEEVLVLDHLSMQMEEGDFVALMGPSGSGKTTLLNIVAGLDRADEGAVVVDGQDLNMLSEAELTRWRADHIGFVFQFYNLIPVLTALENVELPLLLLALSARERRERAAFALEIVGLAERTSHLPSQLSGGQEQRVAIARAIVSDPKIIIADEPTGDLDRQSATEVMELLARLTTEHKKSILMVTHDEVVARYARRIVRLDKGKVL